MSYVLILLIFTGANGTPAATSIEFSSPATCKAAIEKIVADKEHAAGGKVGIIANCVPK